MTQAKSFGQIEAPLRRFSHRLIGVPGGFAELERVVARLSLDTALLDGRKRNIRGKIMRLFLARQRARAPNQAKVKLEQWLEAGDLEAPLPQPTGDGLTGEDARFLSQLEEQVSNAKNVADKWYWAKFLMGRLENPPPTRNIFDAGVAVRFAKLRSDLLVSYAEVRRSIERIGQDVESLVDLLEVLGKAKTDKTLNFGANLQTNDLTRVETFLDHLLEKRLEDLSKLEPDIEDVLDKIHLLVAGAIILRPAGRKGPNGLSALGLVNTEIPRGYADDILLIMAVLSTLLFAFNYLYQVCLGSISPVSVTSRLVFSTVIVHGVSSVIALTWRQKKISNDTYQYLFERNVNVPVRQYAWLGGITFTPAYLGLLVWTAFIFALPNSDNHKLPSLTENYAPLGIAALGGVVTAIFIVCNLDMAERRPVSNLTILRQSLTQGLLTALMAFLAMQVQLHGTSADGVLDVIGTGFMTGAAIGVTVLKITSKARKQSLAFRESLTPASKASSILMRTV